MGWQSYVLYYSNDDEKREILQRIKNHDEYGKTCDVEDYTLGEELHSIRNAELKPTAFSKFTQREKIYIPHILGDEPIGMIICGNGGGRSSTFEYLKNLVCFPYMKKHDKQHKKKSVEMIYLNNVYK